MNAKAKKITKIVVDVCFWVFFVLALVFTIFAFASQSSTRGYTKFGNKAYFTIESTSMQGTINKGDLITTKVLTEEEKSQLQENDVITYYWDLNGDGALEANTHRIVKVEKENDEVVGYYTKGDNNNSADGYLVTLDRVEAKWTGKKIGGLGGFVSFLQKPYGFWPVIIAPLTCFLGYEIYVLIDTINKMKNKDKRVITAAEEELIKQQAIEEFLKKQEAEKAQENKDLEK